jgi:uncharacterized protein YwqG
MNNKTKDGLKNLLKPLVKKATKIIVKEQLKENPAGADLKSHFFGPPYFEKGEKWPETKNGDKLEFLFQIFNEDSIVLPENIKLLQFFYGTEDHIATDTEDDRWLVKIYENLCRENREIIETPAEYEWAEYREIAFEPMVILPGWEGLDDNIANLLNTLNEDYFKIVKALGDNDDARSFLGGYPQWIQGDQSPKKDNFELLFQIDSLDINRHWYDCGEVYVFYNRVTKETEMVLQYC